MARKTGYLASLLNIPPLIFRFQFNPDILSEKKSFKYNEGQFGKWGFDKTSVGGLAAISGFLEDLKEFGPLLTRVLPLVPDKGEQRVFAIDFSLDASTAGPMDGDDHYGGSIEPDLALLRSFMMPSVELTDLPRLTAALHEAKPPECTLVYGGFAVGCAMTDQNIKITAFADDGKPKRADVSVTLKEQAKSLSAVPDMVKRYVDVVRSYNRKGMGEDFLAVTPIVNLFL